MKHKIDKAVLQEYLDITNQWNFDLAVEKLIEKDSGKWNLGRAESALLGYKRYMALTKALGGLQLVPNADIDEIWHMHILDTRAYMADCDELFGEYLHHYPYFGMLGEENKKEWIQVQNESDALWQDLFGEQLYQTDREPQKCPQVCPCHIGDTVMTTSGLTSIQKSA
ncbi:hypothetical protein [Thalassolituus sp.]|jgi:hypothetical protein|uniref:glycine-rich domain-containing protein n=1 Tax=Thalassolituus sp. TaxID=2030822 RepID=UPI002A7EC3DB|nr:hypothetical protein [Thalassolituus sp.]|tara:strand:- start:11569 stop:12072 length:504 start_codon:yes stop_codon:yes gene_type:complete